MLQSANLTKERFEGKAQKRSIEETFANVVSAVGKGNILMLTGPALEKHWETHKQNVAPRGRMVVVEWDKTVREDIEKQAKNIGDERIVVRDGDILDAMFEKPTSRKNGAWTYIDLDFCKTFPTIEKHSHLSEKLRRLTVSPMVGGRFCLSITFSTRSDTNSEGARFLRETVARIFEAAGWQVVEQHVKGYHGGMITSLYRFYKPKSKPKQGVLDGSIKRPNQTYLEVGPACSEC